MMNKQPPRWIPLEKLPLFSEAVEKMAHDTQEIGRLLAQAKNKPWVLDEATVHRANDLLTERLEILALYTEQLHRWKKEQLTSGQEKRIARLEKKMGNAVEEAKQLLDLVNDIKQNTLDRILSRDDMELALDVLSGKLRLPGSIQYRVPERQTTIANKQ
jgi:hypothetical protein